jgi:selenocysteine lyase/cysteine desulfurase
MCQSLGSCDWRQNQSTSGTGMQTLQAFFDEIAQGGIAALRNGLIGEDIVIDGPQGPRPLIYADYVASGRALRQVETFIMERVLPYYANSHTEASYCGAYCTRLREEARRAIAGICGVETGSSVIFTGSGATSAINRLCRLTGAADRVLAGESVVVLIGPYEHHSNILPWRESGARVIEIDEGPEGGPSLGHLRDVLGEESDADLLIGSFSAASNVTGIVSDVDAVTTLLKEHGALAIWDYAGAAPYLDMAMRTPSGAPIDAIVVSPHKFPGGPGASGLLMVRDAISRDGRPTAPGGGSVTFVSPWSHDYSSSIVAREEAGTPNVVGDIRAALVLLVKKAVGQDFIAARNAELRQRAEATWSRNARMELLGHPSAQRLPVFSFRVRAEDGGYVHHQLFTRMLSDFHGIQARGGCACAGPYGHRLLGIDEATSQRLHAAIRSGREVEKPGWVRLNLSYLMDDAKADAVITAVDELAREAELRAKLYECDSTTARFRHSAAA